MSLSYTPESNPLLIDLVLETLFSTVDYSTLKECRMVNSKWKRLSDPKFIQHSTLIVDINKIENKIAWEHFPVDIPSMFSSIDQQGCQIEFFTFKFLLNNLTVPLREMYFKPNVKTMTHLELEGSHLWESEEAIVHRNFDPLIGPKLVKLKVRAVKDVWQVSLDKLLSVRQITLNNFAFNVSCSAKMAPYELKLYHCSQVGFVRPMRDYIDFSSVRKLHLERCERYAGALPVLTWSDLKYVKSITLAFMTINLVGSISPEELTLRGNDYKVNGVEVSEFELNDYVTPTELKIICLSDDAIILNWDENLEIDELDIDELHDITIGEMSTEAKIKKLKIKQTIADPITGSVIIPVSVPEYNPGVILDLSTLPQTLEYLELTTLLNVPIVCSRPVCFPTLNHLLFKGSELEYFQNCQSIISLTLKDRYACIQKLNVDHLSPNVKNLKFEGPFDSYEITGNKMIKLNRLVFHCHYDMESFIRFFVWKVPKYLKADFVIFHLSGYNMKNENFGSVIDLVLKRYKEKVAVGPIWWALKAKKEEFQKSLFFPHVDKISEYYLFENAKGRGVTKSEFSKMISFDF